MNFENGIINTYPDYGGGIIGLPYVHYEKDISRPWTSDDAVFSDFGTVPE